MFTHDMEENRKSKVRTDEKSPESWPNLVLFITKVDIIDLDGDIVHDMIIYIYSEKVLV